MVPAGKFMFSLKRAILLWEDNGNVRLQNGLINVSNYSIPMATGDTHTFFSSTPAIPVIYLSER